MNTTTHRLALLATAAALTLGAAPALAQSQPAKPGARAAKALPSTDEGKRRGKGDIIMSREELRACMALKDGNDKGSVEMEGRRAELDRERAQLAGAADSGAAVRAAVEEKMKAVQELDAALDAHGKAVQDWNERMADFEKRSKDMRNADRRRQVLKQEQYALKANEDKLMAERKDKVAVYEAAVKDANDRIAQGGQRNADWNARNEQLAAAEQDLLDARRKWAAECGDRRFREEDEIAIRAGK